MRTVRTVLLLLLAACAPSDAALEAWSADGAWHLTAATVPDPPTAGAVHLTFDLTDADGDPVEVAHLELTAWMAAHDHAEVHTRAGPDGGDVADGPGRYAGTLTLAMPGRWILDVAAEGDATDPGATLVLDVR